MAGETLNLTAGAGIDLQEGTGANAGKLIISNTGSSGPALIYYGAYDGDNIYYGPNTNTYLFLTYSNSGGGQGYHYASYSIFTKSFERIETDATSETTDNYLVTYYPLDPRDEYEIQGTGVVPKHAGLGDGTVVANITEWKRVSTAQQE